MVTLANVAFGHMEAGDGGGRLVPGQPSGEKSVAVMLDFKNGSGKAVKSAAFVFLPYNAAGRVVSCERRGQAEARLRFTGAVGPNETRRLYWENVWYSREIARVEPVKLEIGYTDGSAETLERCQIHFSQP